MQKLFIVIAVIVITGVAIVIGTKLQNKDTISYTLQDKEYRLLVADTQEEHEKGLMYYKELTNADGMIFIFPEKSIHSFWNKNTFMDLDVYWVNNNKVVGKSFLPSIEKSKDIQTINSPEAVDVVIEIVK